MARDRTAALFRRGAREVERVERVGSSYAHGMTERAKAATRPDVPPGDDLTLKHKLETELFRPADAPKGSVNIEVVDGVVTLRGQVPRPEDVRELEAQARLFAGVRDVHNLLHTPGTPAPNLAELRSLG